MKANTPKRSFAVVVLTALGVLPIPSAAAPSASALRRLGPIELEHATVAEPVKRTHDDIRAGRLGH